MTHAPDNSGDSTPKRFFLPADQIKPMANGHGACFATDMIMVDGLKVGYMYREEPHHDSDSGWVFMAGLESQEYMDNPDNLGLYDVNAIANYDPDIIPFLDAPLGSAMARDPETGLLEPEFAPPDSRLETEKTAITADMPTSRDMPETAITAELPKSHDECDECGCPLHEGEGILRSKTETEVLLAVAYHRAIHLWLCPKCADQYDGTSNRMMWGLAAFVGLIITIALASWIWPRAF